MQGEQDNNNNYNKGAHKANESTVQTVVSQLQNQIYLDIEIVQHARVVRRSPARGDKSYLDLAVKQLDRYLLSKDSFFEQVTGH